MNKPTLKQALKNNQLDQFIEEHKDLVGNEKNLESTIKTMSESSKPVHQTSAEADDEN